MHLVIYFEAVCVKGIVVSFDQLLLLLGVQLIEGWPLDQSAHLIL